ncbi:phosphotransferase family protein [Microvirga pudoricolor]|uniref:phosphotransferase family protein n=1 Tax=Microvirga pudoricolor TaxID=2778729 RepID=UPI001950BBA2|nr:aminoglycoside phosphotransferase family protein [Microvirga pudoricolor]MBM6592688.1 aminoglycoside phosphotransferase family protein [Microvirga pudoricolor]
MTAALKSATHAFDERDARAFAREVVAHHFGGAKPKKVNALGGGLTNFVFEVNHAEGDFIVRMGTEAAKVKEYLKEQWAIAKAGEAGVPTAEVLEVGADLIPLPYMIARKVEGTEAVHHPERFAILREMGRLTATIHSIKTSGFGHTFDWSNNQLSRNETWKDYLHGELKVGTRLAILEKEKMLDPAPLKRMKAVVREMERWKDPKPVLNHGDMRLKNVMVDEDGTITAVIDWEFCSSNLAPYWDLSLALHDLSIDAKQEFLKGYGLSEAELREMAPVIKAINLLNYAPFVERAAAEGDKPMLEQYRTRLSGALDLYAI